MPHTAETIRKAGPVWAEAITAAAQAGDFFWRADTMKWFRCRLLLDAVELDVDGHPFWVGLISGAHGPDAPRHYQMVAISQEEPGHTFRLTGSSRALIPKWHARENFYHRGQAYRAFEDEQRMRDLVRGNKRAQPLLCRPTDPAQEV